MSRYREVIRELVNGDRKLIPTLKGAIKKILSRPPRGVKFGAGSVIERPRVVAVPACVSIGDRTWIGPHARIDPILKYAGAKYSPQILIGNDVYIGPYLFLASIGRVTIGDGCVLSEQVYINNSAHGLDPEGGLIMEQPLVYRGDIEIGGGSFIGFRCSILPGVTLGEHCVVGLDSVVTRSFPAYSMIAGAPARVLKSYSLEKKMWLPVEDAGTR